MTATTITAAITTAALAAGGCAYAALYPQSQLFGRIFISPPRPNELALTYDDGPNPAATPQLLDILSAAKVRATFFLIGRFVRSEPELTRRIAAAGHVIGNHTMTHPWLAWQSGARIRQEMADCNAILEDTIGAAVRLFRPPHGARRPYVLRSARELGLVPINWNVMANDWTPVSASVILARIQQGISGRQREGRATNILLHDGSDEALGANRLPSVEATRQLLELYRNKPERFVTPLDWLEATPIR